jgi:SAM-dependent methyltransferase
MGFWKRIFRWPRVGKVDLGDLRRVEPFSREWGFDRGKPVDRYFIERFLDRHAGDIRGRVLEVGTDLYTRRFGGGKVSTGDVLHVSESKPGVTIIADLTRPEQLPAEAFDCLILTNTVQFIFDFEAVLRTAQRILRPGGVLLLTVPGVSAISRYDYDPWGEFWRFTTLSLERLLKEAFPRGEVDVEGFGNVLVCAAFLYGLTVEEFQPSELDHGDPDYELVVCGRARKASPGGDPDRMDGKVPGGAE